MKREKITPTDEFSEAVEEYQKANNIKSWSQALLELAALGLQQKTGKPSPQPYRTWGGRRVKSE